MTGTGGGVITGTGKRWGQLGTGKRWGHDWDRGHEWDRKKVGS